MKNTKKILSLLLAIQLLLSCALSPIATATDSVMEEPIDAVEALVIDEVPLGSRLSQSCRAVLIFL